MGRLTKFQEDWLTLIDVNGNAVNLWCSQGKDDFHAFCRFCKKEFATGNSGKAQVLQHAKTEKHKKNVKDICDSSQLKLKTLFTASGNRGVGLDLNDEATTQSKAVTSWDYGEEEKILRAEILWILHVAVNNYTFSSCDRIVNLFSTMFPGVPEAKGMKLSARKVSYEISHGLGPYFLSKLSQMVSKCEFFTLMYDETLNESNKKQLDIYIRFWNHESNAIQQSYVSSEILFHATAVNIDSALMKCLNSANLPFKKIIMLGSDGPHVNKAAFKIMNKRLQDMTGEGLINIGTCNLHIVHNAFGEGLKIESFQAMTDFLEDIDVWFKKYPSRQEDLAFSISDANLEDSVYHTLRYVSNRWLTLVPACKRILQLYPALKNHFLKDLIKNKSPLIKCDRYKRIRNILNSDLTLAYLHFLVSVGSVFEHFLLFLQSNKTLIHVLYDEISSLIQKLLFRFINMDEYKNMKGEDLLTIPLKEITEKNNLKYVDVGCETSAVLANVEAATKRCFKLDAQNFYLKTTEYLLEKLPLKNKLLQCLQIFHPLVRTEPISTTTPIIKHLVKMLPRCFKPSEYDQVIDEWRLYTADEEIIDDWCHEKDSNGEILLQWKEIDLYWHKVMTLINKNTQCIKYPHLKRLAKVALCLSHGQAPVERGFSINKRMMSDRSGMNPSTIAGLRLIKDNVTRKVSETLITRKMISFYKEAHSKYKADLKANETKVKKIDKNISKESLKVDAKEKLNNLKGSVESAQKLIHEGNKRLEIALKRKSFEDVAAAQALIVAGNKKLKAA